MFILIESLGITELAAEAKLELGVLIKNVPHVQIQFSSLGSWRVVSSQVTDGCTSRCLSGHLLLQQPFLCVGDRNDPRYQ